MGGALPFADFLDLLRAMGVPVGINDYQSLGLLLSRWRGTDPDELGAAIAALLSRSPAESARIVELFRQYCSSRPAPPPAMEPARRPTPPPAPPPPRSGIGRRLALWGSLLLIIVLATLLVRRQIVPPVEETRDLGAKVQVDLAGPAPVIDLGAGVDAGPLDGGTPDLLPPPDLATPLAPTLPQDQTLSGVRLGWAAALAGLFGLLLGALLSRRWPRGVHHRIGRDKLDALPGPRYYALPLTDLPPAFSREELDGLASVFDRLRVVSAGRRQLDVPRTLQRTLSQEQPPLAFHPEILRQPLLVLYDQGQDMRIWGRKIRDLLDGLSARGILLSVYSFVGVADRLRPDAGGRELELIEVWSRNPDAAVLVLSTGLYAVDAQSGQAAGWVQQLSRWPRLTWVNPIGDPELFAPALRSLPVRVWPMTYWGLLAAAYSVLHDVNQHFQISPQRLYRARPVRPDDVALLCRLLSLAPSATLALAEYFRQHFAPAVPEEVILHLRAASLQPGGELLRFPPQPAGPLSRKEEAALRLLRDLLSAVAPPPGSAAELRWRLDRALVTLRLPDPRGVSHPGALTELTALSHSPLGEEVSERVQETGAAGPAALPQLPQQLESIFRTTLREARDPFTTLKVALGTAAAAAALLIGVLIPTKVLHRPRTEAETQQLLSTWVDKGRQLLLSGKPEKALLWLDRAYRDGSSDPSLPVLLHQAAIPASGDWTPIATLPHDGGVLACAFSPDGTRVVTGTIITGTINDTARVWRVDGATMLASLHGHSAAIRSVAFSPDGKKVVTGSMDRTARIWSADGSGSALVFTGHTDGVTSALFSPDGKSVITGSLDNTVRAWSADGSGAPSLFTHQGGVLAVAFSPDGKSFATGSADKSARIWQTGSQAPIELPHKESVLSVAFSPDGKKLATGSGDGITRIWNSDGTVTPIVLKGAGSVWSVSYDPSGSYVLTSRDRSKSAWLFAAETGQLLSELRGHTDSVLQAAYSPDGRSIVTASADGTARVWQKRTSPVQAELLAADGRVESAVFSPDGRSIVTVLAEDIAQVWDGESGLQLADLKGHAGRIMSAAFSPDSGRIVTAGADGSARVWEARSGRLLAELKGHKSLVASAAYSPDGARIVTAGADGTARLWDARTGAAVAVLQGHGGSVLQARFSSDGQRVVTASSDNTARVWEVKSGRPLVQLSGHKNEVLDARFSPDGRRIVTVSKDGTARIWVADSGRPQAIIPSFRNVVHTAQYSPDGQRLVIAYGDGAARVWEAESGRLLETLSGHQKEVVSAAFSPNGRQIVTASSDRTAVVWDAASGRRLIELKGHADAVTSASYSPDGSRIVTSSSDKTVRIWDVSPETRTPDQLAALIRCYLSVRFASPDSEVIVAQKPNPSACALPAPPEDRAEPKPAEPAQPDSAQPAVAAQAGGGAQADGIPGCAIRTRGGLSSIRSAWGTTVNDLWAVSQPGAVYHYDGVRWTVQYQSKFQLYGIWGAGPKDIWATGFGGLLIHYDGASWTQLSTGTNVSILSVRGAGQGELWGVGHGGLLLHYKDGAWSRTTVGGVTSDLAALWQSSDGTGWAVGWNGSILARRDNSWSAVPSGTKHDLTAIWGSAPGDIWIAGKGGFVSHYDGRSWTPAPSMTTSNFWSVFGTSGQDVWVAGVGPVIHYDGTQWTAGQKDAASPILALGGNAAEGVFGVAEDGTILSCQLRSPPPKPWAKKAKSNAKK